jgi:hypothetical protein
MKIPTKVVALMKTYYDHYRAQNTTPWDKQADLKNIFDAAKAASPRATYIQAMAGTFWITWGHVGIQTTHCENNYWTGKVMARLDRKNKKYVPVRGAF